VRQKLAKRSPLPLFDRIGDLFHETLQADYCLRAKPPINLPQH